MAESRFRRPDFLDQHSLRTEHIYDDRYKDPIEAGRFTVVRAIPEIYLPARVKEGFKEGFVIKQYKELGGFHKNYTEEDELLLYGQVGLSLAEKRNILRERFKQIRDYFLPELPQLLLRTTIFIGTNKKGRKGLYEIQPFLKDFIELGSSNFIGYHVIDDRLLYDIATAMSQLDPDARKQVGRQLRMFIEKARAMPDEPMGSYFHDKFLDLFGADNLVVSRDGILHLPDTNLLWDRSYEPPVIEHDKHPDERLTNRAPAIKYRIALDGLSRVADMCESL